MSVIFILICFSLLVAAGFLFAFIWAVRSGQYHDTYTPSVRILLDEKNTRAISSLRGEGRDAADEAGEQKKEIRTKAEDRD